MGPKCIVLGCQKNKINKQHLFNFPKDVETRGMWLWLIGREDVNAIDVKKHMKVCSQHFHEDDYFIFSTKAVLKPNRAPQAINNKDPLDVSEAPTKDDYFVFSTKAVLKPNRAPQAINNEDPLDVSEAQTEVPTKVLTPTTETPCCTCTKRKTMECSTDDVAALKSKIADLENEIRALKKKKRTKK